MELTEREKGILKIALGHSIDEIGKYLVELQIEGGGYFKRDEAREAIAELYKLQARVTT